LVVVVETQLRQQVLELVEMVVMELVQLGLLTLAAQELLALVFLLVAVVEQVWETH
jgi:hypothetical protein